MFHRKCLSASILALGIACFFSSDAQADKPPRRCSANGAVFESEFFGYYPTCWRRFPPQPECCPAPETQPKPEALPAPKPAAKAPAPLKDEAKPEVKELPKPKT
jgi:hypothetical protein